MEETTKKSNSGLVAGIVVAVLAVVIGAITLVVYFNQPQTLEQYYKSDSEVSKQVDETKNELTTDGLTTDITFSGNTMKFTMTLSDEYAANSNVITQYYNAKKDDISSAFKEIIKDAEHDGLKNVAITLEVVSNDNTIWSYTEK